MTALSLTIDVDQLRDLVDQLVDARLAERAEALRHWPPAMTVADAAAYMGKSRATIGRWLEAGVLEALDLPGDTLIARRDLDALQDRKGPRRRRAAA